MLRLSKPLQVTVRFRASSAGWPGPDTALPDSVCPGSPCGHASSPRAPARARSAKTFRARIRLLEARKLEHSGFRFPLACSGNLGVAQDTRFAAGAGRNRREFVMKTSENRSEQDAKIIGMSRPTASVVGRRRAPEPAEDVLSEPLMDVQGVVAFLHVSKSMVYKLAE